MREGAGDGEKPTGKAQEPLSKTGRYVVRVLRDSYGGTPVLSSACPLLAEKNNVIPNMMEDAYTRELESRLSVLSRRKHHDKSGRNIILLLTQPIVASPPPDN